MGFACRRGRGERAVEADGRGFGVDIDFREAPLKERQPIGVGWRTGSPAEV